MTKIVVSLLYRTVSTYKMKAKNKNKNTSILYWAMHIKKRQATKLAEILKFKNFNISHGVSQKIP